MLKVGVALMCIEDFKIRVIYRGIILALKGLNYFKKSYITKMLRVLGGFKVKLNLYMLLCPP